MWRRLQSSLAGSFRHDSVCETAGSTANMHIYISKPIGTILKISLLIVLKPDADSISGAAKEIMHKVRSNKSPIKSDS